MGSIVCMICWNVEVSSEIRWLFLSHDVLLCETSIPLLCETGFGADYDSGHDGPTQRRSANNNNCIRIKGAPCAKRRYHTSLV